MVVSYKPLPLTPLLFKEGKDRTRVRSGVVLNSPPFFKEGKDRTRVRSGGVLNSPPFQGGERPNTSEVRGGGYKNPSDLWPPRPNGLAGRAPLTREEIFSGILILTLMTTCLLRSKVYRIDAVIFLFLPV